MLSSLYSISSTRSNFLIICLLISLSACGGGTITISQDAQTQESQLTETDNTQQEETLADSGSYVLIRGAAVKGPLAYATVKVFKLDTTLPGFYDSQDPIAQGFSDTYANFIQLRVRSEIMPPFVLLVDGSNSIDLTTRTAPILKTLVTVVTQDMLDEKAPIYATPLTTMTWRIMALQAGLITSNDEFLIALDAAANQVKAVFGVGMSEDIDIFRDPPIINDATNTLDAQQRVAEHRVAIEGFATTLHNMALMTSNELTQFDADTLLATLALDLHADGRVDGFSNDTPLDGIDPMAFDELPASIVIANSDYTLADTPTVLSRDLDFMSTKTTYDPSSISLDFSNKMLLTQAIESLLLRLSWDPSSGVVDGYLVYTGSAPDTVSTQIADIVLANNTINPTSPEISFDGLQDLKLSVGDNACFRLKAYNEVGASGFSEAVCTLL